MPLDKLLVIAFSLFGVGFTYWFFLMRKELEIAVTSDSVDSTGSLQVDITVDGGYNPEVISIPKGKTTKLNFRRTDPSSCLEEVVLSDFKVRKALPLNQTVTIPITPQNEGEYVYSCGMNMFHGKIVVR